MKSTRFLMLAFVLLIGATIPAQAKSVKRITFKRGSTKTVVIGTLKSFKDSQDYVIKVRKGQTLNISQAKNGGRDTHYIYLTIANPNNEDASDADASCNSNKKVTPTIAGDYKIHVVECQKADAWNGRYKIRISVK